MSEEWSTEFKEIPGIYENPVNFKEKTKDLKI